MMKGDDDRGFGGRWFTEKLAFEKRMDLAAPGMRWLTIAPRKQKESAQLPGQIRAWFSSD